jgi:glutamine synthetase
MSVTLADPLPGGRPGEVALAQRLAGDLAAQGVHGVVLPFVDTAGITRVKTVPVSALESAVRWGVGMSPVFDLFLADDSIVSSDRQGGPDGDLRHVPDLAQLTPLAGQPGWAWAPVDRMTQEGMPHHSCSRSLLRHLVSSCAQRGLTFRASFEIEFALSLPGDGPSFVPACQGPAYGATRLVEQSDFCAAGLAALAAQGVPVDQIHPEYAAGQYEVSVGALDPVGAADRSLLVRQTLRAVAQQHGLRISFAPSVLAGGVGNGGHVHLSLWRDGENQHGTGDLRYSMTAAGESFVAGVLTALPALAAVSTPSPSSYLRLQPSHWAGVYRAWGHETREAALRVVTGTRGQRATAANLEVKCADLAANPYLLLTGLITAGLAGVDGGLPLVPEITGDPAGLPPGRAPDRLPMSLTEAVSMFSAWDLSERAFGEFVPDAVVAVRRGEIARTAGLDDAAVAEAYRWVY